MNTFLHAILRDIEGRYHFQKLEVRADAGELVIEPRGDRLRVSGTHEITGLGPRDGTYVELEGGSAYGVIIQIETARRLGLAIEH
ncbi:MAG TPA: hypothetical protein VFC78_21185 [Tepidisphaeraceae bacterium]|nr:hypothetical protein [Tepidisphaeraceae bacterium]